MHHFLISLNKEVLDASGFLSTERQNEVNLAHKAILDKDEIECPEAEVTLNDNGKPKKGRAR